LKQIYRAVTTFRCLKETPTIQYNLRSTAALDNMHEEG